MAKNNSYKRLIKEQFEFLESKYKFKCIEYERSWWGWTLLYLSEKTGVRITYEHREFYVIIRLYQLVNRQLIEHPGFWGIENDTTIYDFGLGDIILLRNPKALIKPGYDYNNNSKYHDEKKGYLTYISDFAKNLEKYADDVLRGDFTIFKEAEKAVKERAKKYREEN